MSENSKAPFEETRLVDIMQDADIELLLASTRHNIRYLTGGYYYPLYMWDAHARRTQYLSFVCIPAGDLDASFFVGRPGESEVMAESEVWPGTCYESEKIASLSTAARTVEVLKERGLDNRRIAVEMPSLPADVFEVLKVGLPHAEFVNAVPTLDKLRARKRPDEIETYREGARMVQEALAEVLTSRRDGATTAEIAAGVASEYRKRGLHFLYALVCAGPHLFRAPSQKRAWHTDRPIHIDSGALVDGYVVELCRMGFLGTPSALAEDLLQGCRDLESAVREVLRPGVEARAVVQRAQAFLDGYSLGEYGRFVAHGIGMVHHEDPEINAGNTEPLEEGMVISLELEFLHSDVGHVKLENLVVITADGNDWLNPPGNDWYLSSP